MTEIEVSTGHIITGSEASIQIQVLKDVPFAGQGFYLLENATVVVVKHPPIQASSEPYYRAYIYRVPWEETIFGRLAELDSEEKFPIRYNNEEAIETQPNKETVQ